MQYQNRMLSQLLVLALFCLAQVLALPVYQDMIPNGHNLDRYPGVGHNKREGGGPLNMFGLSFAQDNGYKWTAELCVADSDGDGLSNGAELGDPCCVWKPGLQPMRSHLLSHPGYRANRANLTDLGYTATGTGTHTVFRHKKAHMEEVELFIPALDSVGTPDCECLKLLGSEGERTDKFWDFYFTGKFHEGLGHGVTFQEALVDFAESSMYIVTHPQKVKDWLLVNPTNFCTLVILFMLGYMWYLDTWSQAKQLSWRTHIVLLTLIAIYIDMASCFLHLVLDNSAYNSWPVVGGTASQFQGHHWDPTGITRAPWKFFLTQADLILGLILGACFLVFRKDVRLRVVAFHGIWMTKFMMASHRWSHMPPAELPAIVAFFQDTGILLHAAEHSKHHTSYDNNFSIFGGWTNPLMNIVNRYLIDPLWMGWSPVLVVWCFVPALVCALGNSKRMLALVESIWGDYNNTLKASVMGLTEQAAKTVTWTDSRGFLGLCGFSSTVWLFLCLCTTYGPFSLLSLHAWGASAVTTLLLIKPVLALVRVRGSGFVPESQTTAGRVAPYAALVCSVFAAMIAQHSDRMTATVPSMTYIHDQDVGKLLHAFVGYTAVLAVLMAFLCSHCGVLQDKKAQLHKAALYLCLIASAAGCYRSFYQTESAATLYVYLALGIAVAGYVQDIPVFART